MPNAIWLGTCPPMNASQCYEARLLLGISKEELAERAIVTVKIISDFEAGRRPLRADTSRMIRKALEQSGVIFSDKGDMPPVRLQEDVALI